MLLANPDATERLLIRQWNEKDRAPFAEMMADPEFNRYMPGPFSRSESDRMIDRFQAHHQEHGFGMWAVELQEQTRFIGCVGLVARRSLPCSPCIEIGWRIAPRFWKQGFATEGAKSALDFGFRSLLLNEIVSFTVPQNLASRRVMEKIGMTHDPAEDFEHPALEPGDPLRHHVLYRIRRAETD